MSTRLDLQNRLGMFFQNNTYYQTIDFNDSLQDGIDEIAAFTGCIYNSATLPFTANTTYYDLLTLLPDYIGVVAIFSTGINRFLIPTSLTKLDQDRIDWEVAAGTPYYFVPISHRYIAIYKKPITAGYGNFFIYYRAAAPQLTDTTLIPIPEDHMYALETYSECDLLEQNQEWNKATAMFQNYQKELVQLKLYMRSKLNPDRVSSLRANG
jgi:hypothetical protein